MRRTALLLLCLLALAGCAPVSTTPVASSGYADAERLMQQGQYREAAQAWSVEAKASRGQQRDAAWLRAAEAWQLADAPTETRDALAQSKRRRLQGDDLLRHDMVNAGVALAQSHVRDAAALLAQPRTAVPASMQARWHALRAQLFEAQGDGFASAAERAQWSELLGDRNARMAQGREIDRLLAALPDTTLAERSAALPAGHPLYPYAGRALTRRGLPLPRPYARAGLPDAETLPPAERDGYRPPLRISVLLPLSGALAPAGQSVRDGLLAGYFEEARRRPQLRFHDTAKGLDAALAAAKAGGAQLVIGPLSREEVAAVFERSDIGIPVLALNRAAAPPPSGSATFALAPDDEGAAAADRLLDRGLRRVIVITQTDDTAQRGLQGFRERLQTRGGEIAAEVQLSESNPDYMPALQQAITQAGGNPPQALFLTLKAGPARLLAAQLELAGLAELPRVATSLILSGGNPRMDSELDGIEFPELPWLLGLRSALPEPEGLGRRLPTAQGGGARLFAFGLDAWRLAAYLEHLGRHPDEVIFGATGELRLDGFGIVSREPEWAVFSGGRPRPALDGVLLPDAGQQP